MVQQTSASGSLTSVQVWQLSLFQTVLDPASLDIFWAEITAGAYGKVDRVEGFFNLADGRGFQFRFIAGETLADEDQYIEVNDAPCLVGRPDRPSGLQVVGDSVDGEGIQATLAACSLSDPILAYHQSQMTAEA